jgi:hypothetical protein
MIREATDPAFVRAQLQAVRAHIAAGADPELAARAVDALPRPASASPSAALLAALPADGLGAPSSGGTPIDPDIPFLARDPITAMLQTTLEEQARLQHPEQIGGEPAEAAPATTAFFLDGGQFTNTDPRWVTEVAKALVERIAKGNHPFNPVPAERTASGDARIVLVGDWGSGLPRARDVATRMAAAVAEAHAAGRDVHVIHLGDVYYSGDKGEYDERLLADWPLTAELAADGVGSWSLSGNHDMYSGGWAYFDHLLVEPRFSMQRSPDGKGTSWFRLSTPSWEIIGLDTAWDPDPLAMGHRAVLEDPQGDYVTQLAAGLGNKKLLLLSHHQLVSVFSPGDLGKVLPRKLATVLADGRVTAWFWGHEHRCMAFEAAAGVRYPRCLGHGGVPVLTHAANTPIPSPGVWEERAHLPGAKLWARFGFAVLDFDGPQITVRYRNEIGEEAHPETIQ